MPSLGPLIPLTPSPSARNRPQSFAQKLKSTSKSVKGKLGYTNLTETVSTPIKKSPTSSASEHPIQLQKSSSDHKNSMTGVSSLYDYAGHRTSLSNITTTVVLRNAPAACWKTMYHLLDLYATMPETKTVSQRISVSPEATEKTVKKQLIGQHDVKMSSNRDEDDECINTPLPPPDIVTTERSRLVVFGVAKIQKTRLLATLSGLKLEAEIGSLHSSATWRKKSRAALECSHTGQVGRAMIVLLEGAAPSQ
ncbi:Transmembrane protein, partial [Pseudolycoriella hygida]